MGKFGIVAGAYLAITVATNGFYVHDGIRNEYRKASNNIVLEEGSRGELERIADQARAAFDKERRSLASPFRNPPATALTAAAFLFCTDPLYPLYGRAIAENTLEREEKRFLRQQNH